MATVASTVVITRAPAGSPGAERGTTVTRAGCAGAVAELLVMHAKISRSGSRSMRSAPFGVLWVAYCFFLPRWARVLH